MILLVAALSIVGVLLQFILGQWINSKLMFPVILVGGTAAGFGALVFGVSRQFMLRSQSQRTWVGWPLSFALGALVFLPLMNVSLGRTPLGLVPPIGWLLVYFAITITISLGFAYDESRAQRTGGRSSNKALERTRGE